ncbi:MAG: endolytic transglycosylase MltG [Actinomycetota bacterium]|nr:endolytic transglycosylase MltG [Actinomycetota bacterium]
MTDDSLGIFDAGDTQLPDDGHRSGQAGGGPHSADRRERRRAPAVPVLPRGDIDHGDDGDIDDGDNGDDDDDDDEVDLDAVRSALNSTAGAPQAAVPAQRQHTSVTARDRHRQQLLAARRRRRRRRRSVLLALVVLLLIIACVVAGFVWWRHKPPVEVRDYAGNGDIEVIVQVQSGDGLPAIADTLAAAGVVAGPEAFVDSATNDADVAALHPGYYRVRQHSSAAAAADQIVLAANHVGKLRLIPGRQLADVSKGADGGTVPGYLSDIAKAACVPLNGKSDCVTVAQLQDAAKTVSPAELGVVSWAVSDVERAPDPAKRLEGLILPGDYDVPPDKDAKTLLRSVISASTVTWNSMDIISEAAALHISPYRAVVIASMVEREGISEDMQSVARVIYNRLDIKMRLQMDSTVNYALNRAQITTSDADRGNPSPYNTYAHVGLPPTPISSPGEDALNAAMDPTPGNWLYFVKVDKAGNSCFSVTDAEHRKCVAQARAAGVFGG